MNSDEIKAKYKDQLTQENALLLRILDGTSHETGDAFFRSLVKELALVLNSYGALVADYLPEKKQLRPRAYWLGDDALNIHLINPSALKLFDVVDSDMRSTPLQQWLTPAGFQLIQRLIEDLQHGSTRNSHTWIGQGLEGKRRDGETFKIEATLSQGSDAETPSYTLILRDAQALVARTAGERVSASRFFAAA